MKDESAVSPDRDRLLDEIVSAYLKAVEAGERPDPQGWLERHPDFLRLLIVFSAQPPAGDGEIQAVVRRIREHALDLLRAQVATAFGDDPRTHVTDQLARFALAAIDGAFVAIQADRGATLGQLLEPLAPALVASRRVLLAGQGPEGRRAQTERRT